MALCGEWDEEDIDRRFPRSSLEQEGTTGITHMLADAIELWADDTGSEFLRDYARQLRDLAGPLN